MKILQMFDLFNPVVGKGTVILLHGLCKALAERGHQVTLYTSDFELDPEYADSIPEVEVRAFRCASRFAGFYVMPDMVKEARKGLGEFDVIHTHCFRSFQNIVIHHYAKKYGIPYIVDTHGSLPRRTYERRGLKWLLKVLFDTAFGNRILQDAHKVIAETQTGIREYREAGVDGDRIELITPPFDTKQFEQLPPHGQFKERHGIDGKIVLFLGRINKIKGLDFLVHSFHSLTEVRSDTRLIIVGNDEGYKVTLDKLIDRLDLTDKVMFTGFLSGVEKLSALVDANVLAQTSIYEHGTRAPFEAILCDTPIIVTKNTSASENVKKIDAGYLVEYGNKNELRDAMQYVLDHPTEAKLKTEKAKKYIKANLSLAKGVEKYEQLYADCLAARRTN